MLVLSRQRDETIMIGDEIEISVVDIRGDKVRLGINAPTRIAVHRKEVYDAIKRENAQAARLGANDIDSLAQTIKPGPARRVERGQESIGGAQAIRIHKNGVLEGASDPRKDGAAIGY